MPRFLTILIPVSILFGGLVVYLLNRGANAPGEMGLFRGAAVEVKDDGAGMEWVVLVQECKKLHQQDRLDEALAKARQALTVAEKAVGSEHADVATSLHNLGSLLCSAGTYDESEQVLKRALAMREKLSPRENPDIAASVNSLAYLYLCAGRLKEAEPLFLRAIAMRERVLKRNHPNLASSCESYAELLRKTGREDEAKTFEQRAATLRANQDRGWGF